MADFDFNVLASFPAWKTIPKELLPFKSRRRWYRVEPLSRASDRIVWYDGAFEDTGKTKLYVGVHVALRKLAHGAPAPNDEQPKPEMGK